MHVKSVKIDNCKSYKEAEVVRLDPQFSIFVGPNGGGKSNTLDIITVALRRFFLPAYLIEVSEEHGSYLRRIRRENKFAQVRQFLDPNSSRIKDPVTIEVCLTASAADEANIKSILDQRGELAEALKDFRDNPFGDLSRLDSWKPNSIKEDAEFRYKITNDRIETGHQRRCP